MGRRIRRAHFARSFIITFFVLSMLATSAILNTKTFRNDYDSTSHPLADGSKAIADDQCRHVHRVKDQCAFIKINCIDEEAGILSYLRLYYCRLPHAKPVAFVVIALWAALLFSTIGIAASEFFCINISTIAASLGMSESFTGVTFLAFGNGSPDVFSTFAAMNSHSGSMAVGELIGAASFITAVVVGSMAIVRPFKVAKKSFVRDVSFFIVATSFSMVFLANGSLALWECCVMVGFYIFYVGTVVCWHWWLGRRRRTREKEVAARSHFISRGDEIEAYHDDDDETGTAGRNIVTDEDFENLERADQFGASMGFTEEEAEEQRDRWLGELKSNMRVTRPFDMDRQVYNPIRPSLVGALDFQSTLASLHSLSNEFTLGLRSYADSPHLGTTQRPRAVSYDPGMDRQSYFDGISETEGSSSAAYSEVDRVKDNAPHRGRAVSENVPAKLHLNTAILENDGPLQNGRIDPLPPSFIVTTVDTNDQILSQSPMPMSPTVLVSSAADDTSRMLKGSNSETPGETGQYLALPNGADSQPRRNNGADRPPGRSRSSSHRSFRLILPREHPRRVSLVGKRDRSLSTGVAENTFPRLVESPNPMGPQDVFEEATIPPKWWPSWLLPLPDIVCSTLFPTLYDWHNKSILGKIVGVASAPSFFLLAVTLPVVDAEKDSTATDTAISTKSPPVTPATNADPPLIDVGQDVQPTAHASSWPHDSENVLKEITPVPTDGWHRWLVCIQCFTAPLFVVFIFWAGSSDPSANLLTPVLFSLLGSSIVVTLILLLTKPSHPPPGRFLLCFVGFAVSVTWISTIAGEVVAVLKAIGVIFNISDAILGLTIFAVGNSLGDLVSDITIARLGYPMMALSACFGGPLLNILLGIGLGGLFVMVSGAKRRQHKHPGDPIYFKPYRVQVSTTLLISAIALLVTLVGLLILVPLNGWKMDRRIGYGLIVLWSVATVANVVVEVTGWGEEMPRFLDGRGGLMI